MRTLFINVVYKHSPIEMLLWGIGAVIIWILLGRIFKRSEKWWCAWIWFNRAFLIVAIYIIIKYTMMRTGGEKRIRLIPFYSFTFSRTSDRYNTVVANMLLFLPIGLTMPYVLEKRVNHRVRMTIMAAFLFSLFIEVYQYIFGLGLCETDDVIFNTLGAAMGTIAYLISVGEHDDRRKQTTT